MAYQKYDWAQIKADYISTDLSLQELAEKYGASRNTIFLHCKDENWDLEREKYCDSVVNELLRKSKSQQVKKLTNLITCSDQLDQLLIDITKKTKKGGLSAKELECVAKALKLAVDIKRDVNNILTPAQESKIMIERERLGLEKKKVDSNSIDTNITVVLQDEAQEYAE